MSKSKIMLDKAKHQLGKIVSPDEKVDLSGKIQKRADITRITIIVISLILISIGVIYLVLKLLKRI